MAAENLCDDGIRPGDCVGENIFCDGLGHVLCEKHLKIREDSGWEEPDPREKSETMPAPPPIKERTYVKTDASEFKPGVYEHYQGVRYFAIALGWQVSIPAERVVIFQSMLTGEWFVRYWSSPDESSWTDLVRTEEMLEFQPRFKYLGATVRRRALSKPTKG